MTTITTRLAPISRCIPDTLLSIFRVAIEEEAARYSPTSDLQRVRPQAGAIIALVCRQWKEIAYNTPSFWTIISLDTGKYIQNPRSQRLPWHRIKLAKAAPVELYLFNFPANYTNADVISSLLSIVPNLGKLHVELKSFQGTGIPLLLSRAWPALANLQELSYFNATENLNADLSAHLAGMPRLQNLWLNEAGFTVPYCPPSTAPLLAGLKKLHLQGKFNGNGEAAAFLSHLREIEDLHLSAVDPFGLADISTSRPHFPRLTLPKLHKIMSTGVKAIEPFITGEISTPALANVEIYHWKDCYPAVLSSWFTRRSQSGQIPLNRLSLGVVDEAKFSPILAPLTDVRTLSLMAGGKGIYFSQLYEPIDADTHLTSANTLCLPSMRVFELSVWVWTLSVTHFTDFVKARCIPINEQRHTAAGYVAIDKLVINVGFADEVLKDVKHTAIWRDAKMLMETKNCFELRWEYEPQREGTNTLNLRSGE